MPETLHGLEEFIVKEVSRSIEGGEYLDDKPLTKLIDDCDAKEIGRGAECVVVETARLKEESKVLAINYKEQVEPLDTFYLQRIYTTLFPTHFPKFYAAGKLGFTIRERVVGNSLSGRGYLIEDGQEWEGVKNNFSDVYTFIKEVNPLIIFDDTNQNFLLTPDGRVVYVDALRSDNNPYVEKYWDTEQLMKYMSEKGYSEKDVERVNKCLMRLVDLGYTRTK